MTKPNPNSLDSLEMVKVLALRDTVSKGRSIGQASQEFGIAPLLGRFWYQSVIRADSHLIEAVHEGRISMKWFFQLARSMNGEEQRRVVCGLSQRNAQLGGAE